MEKLLRNKTAIILFMAPTLILFTAILLVPIVTSFYYALCDYDKATRAYSFIGFENFSKMFKDPIFWISIKNSLFFLVFSCISQLIFGMLYAALLTNINKGRNFFKNTIYMPCVLSSAALYHLYALRAFIRGPGSSVGVCVPRQGRYQYAAGRSGHQGSRMAV